MPPRKHCCTTMTEAVARECPLHPDRFACPDALIEYISKFDEYGIIIHDGGSAISTILFCPWCGSALPESKRDRWFEELERLGLDPSADDIPMQFQSDMWWSAG